MENKKELYPDIKLVKLLQSTSIELDDYDVRHISTNNILVVMENLAPTIRKLKELEAQVMYVYQQSLLQLVARTSQPTAAIKKRINQFCQLISNPANSEHPEEKKTSVNTHNTVNEDDGDTVMTPTSNNTRPKENAWDEVEHELERELDAISVASYPQKLLASIYPYQDNLLSYLKREMAKLIIATHKERSPLLHVIRNAVGIFHAIEKGEYMSEEYISRFILMDVKRNNLAWLQAMKSADHLLLDSNGLAPEFCNALKSIPEYILFWLLNE